LHHSRPRKIREQIPYHARPSGAHLRELARGSVRAREAVERGNNYLSRSTSPARFALPRIPMRTSRMAVEVNCGNATCLDARQSSYND